MPLRAASSEKVTNYTLNWVYLHDRGSGYMFDCDENGVVDTRKMEKQGRDNLAKCYANEDGALVGPYIAKQTSIVYHPAIMRCACGRELTLDSAWLNTCKCGRDYNGAGQGLASRSQWGEDCYNEYGQQETAADIILGVNTDSFGDW